MRIVQTTDVDGSVVLRLEGKMRDQWVDELRHLTSEILQKPANRLVLDLAEVTFIDTHGLALLHELSIATRPLEQLFPICDASTQGHRAKAMIEIKQAPATGGFEEVVLPHLDAAYRLAVWLVRNEHDAEDVVQDAVLNALRYFRTFTGGNGRAWFLQIVRNTCWARLRKGSLAPSDPFDEEQHSAGSSNLRGSGSVVAPHRRRHLDQARDAELARSFS